MSKTLDGVVTSWNGAAERIFGYTADEAVGRNIALIIPPEKQEEEQYVLARLRRGEKIEHFETERRAKNGEKIYVSLSVSPVKDAHGCIASATKVARDITAQKKAEAIPAREAFLLRLDYEMRSLSGPEEIVLRAARLLAEHLGSDRCSFAEIDPESGEIDVIGNYSPKLPAIVGRYSFFSFGEDFCKHMLAGRPYVFRDSVNELRGEALAAYRALGIAAVITIPLLKDGKLVAGMGLHQATPRNWRGDEIELIGKVAQRCWESLQRARVERELGAHEEQFRTLADTIPNLAWMAHADGHIFWYNRRWYDYTGKSPDEMVGWGWQSVHHPEMLAKVLERWKASIAQGEPFDMVFPLRRFDGRFRSFLTRVEPIKDRDGKVSRWFGTNTDVTAQEEAEQKEKRARETAEILNEIGPLLLAELDPQQLTQKITDIATSAVRAQIGAFFHSLVDERGESYVLYTVSGAPREAFAKFPMPRNTLVFGPTFRGEGVVRSDDITLDPRYGKDPPYQGMPGGHFPVRSYLAAPVISRTGAVIGGLFFGHSEIGVFTKEAEDIVSGIAAQSAVALDNASLFDEGRRSSSALLRSNEELKRLNGDLNQFAYSASHDLREPLRMVSIYTQLLERKLRDTLDEESLEYLDYILEGALRMESLVRDLLAYTQAATPYESASESASVNEALQRAMQNLGAIINESDARISSGELPVVQVPLVQLTQLFQNLIGNAIKYRGKEAPRIDVCATRDGGQWKFAVADNGIGIEEQFKELIFGVFKRLHTSEEYPGTGIGLAICQRIVQRAGGRIWVDSEPGKGSTFFFTLPARD